MSLTHHKTGRDEVCALCDQPIPAGEARWRRQDGGAVSYEHTSCPEEHLTARLPDEAMDLPEWLLDPQNKIDFGDQHGCRENYSLPGNGH